MVKLLLLTATFAFAASTTVDEAQAFLDNAERSLLTLNIESGHADWIRANFITYDSEILSAAAE